MTWIDPSPLWHRKVCFICGKKTRNQAAPLGIVSGRLTCCAGHPDKEVVGAYLRLASDAAYEQQGLPEL